MAWPQRSVIERMVTVHDVKNYGYLAKLAFDVGISTRGPICCIHIQYNAKTRKTDNLPPLRSIKQEVIKPLVPEI